MARIRLLHDIETDKAQLLAGREVLCNWPDAVRMERYGLAIILLTMNADRASNGRLE